MYVYLNKMVYSRLCSKKGLRKQLKEYICQFSDKYIELGLQPNFFLCWLFSLINNQVGEIYTYPTEETLE